MDRRSGFGVAARTVLFVACSAISLAIASRWIKGMLAIGFVSAIATLLLTVVFVRWEQLRLSDAGAELVRGSLGRFVIAFVAGLGLPLLRAGLVTVVTGLRYERVQNLTFSEVVLAFATYIALASREELAFRGYPLQMLDRRFGAWIAQIVIAALFAMEHVLGGWTWWQGLLGSGVGALLFGAAALRTRGLAVPIGLHAAWNFGDTMLGGKGTPGLWRPVIEAHAQKHIEMTQWVSYVFVIMGTTVAIWLWPNAKTSRLKADNVKLL